MYNKILVELDGDQITSIVQVEHKNILNSLLMDLKAREEDRGVAIFHTNKKKDIKEMKKLVKAFKRVMDYC